MQIYDFEGRRLLNAYSSRGSEHLQSYTFGYSLYSYFNLLKSRNLGLFCIALASRLLRGTDGQVTVGEGPGTSVEFTAPPSYSPLCLHPLALSALLYCPGPVQCEALHSGHWHKGRSCPVQELPGALDESPESSLWD